MRRADRQIKNNSDIESVISICDVCRIAFAVENTPYIVAMNFGYRPGENPCLYFHCAHEGRKIDFIAINNYVCFQMDTNHSLYSGKKGCDWGMNYSSILGYGRISIISDNREKKEGLDLIMAHYSGRNDFSYDDRIMDATTILRLDIEEITGKQK